MDNFSLFCIGYKSKIYLITGDRLVGEQVLTEEVDQSVVEQGLLGRHLAHVRSNVITGVSSAGLDILHIH